MHALHLPEAINLSYKKLDKEVDGRGEGRGGLYTYICISKTVHGHLCIVLEGSTILISIL